MAYRYRKRRYNKRFSRFGRGRQYGYTRRRSYRPRRRTMYRFKPQGRML